MTKKQLCQTKEIPGIFRKTNSYTPNQSLDKDILATNPYAQ